ncbi:hypothetical protein [Tractidigestivibacter sp.]|uniref:hypothetical protein n=1 Tax=Tractidigestivibacter sp. TaxID=2847320 RepID=UPI003FD86865
MPGGPARSRAYTNNYDTINDFFYGRGLSGVSPAEFVGMLGEWMGRYRSGRLRAFREGDGVVWDTIDGRRARLGLGTA